VPPISATELRLPYPVDSTYPVVTVDQGSTGLVVDTVELDTNHPLVTLSAPLSGTDPITVSYKAKLPLGNTSRLNLYMRTGGLQALWSSYSGTPPVSQEFDLLDISPLIGDAVAGMLSSNTPYPWPHFGEQLPDSGENSLSWRFMSGEGLVQTPGGISTSGCGYTPYTASLLAGRTLTLGPSYVAPAGNGTMSFSDVRVDGSPVYASGWSSNTTDRIGFVRTLAVARETTACYTKGEILLVILAGETYGNTPQLQPYASVYRLRQRRTL
jgi:hypothetical protein